MTHSSVLSSVKFALVAILCSTLINRGFGQKSGNLVPIKDDDADRSTLPTILIVSLYTVYFHLLINVFQLNCQMIPHTALVFSRLLLILQY